MTRMMKDSGVEWIGEIPENWELKKLKYDNLVIMGQSPSSDEYNIDGAGFPFLQGNADFTGTYPNARVYTVSASKFSNTNDILFSVRAPVGEKNISDKQYAIGRGLCAIRAINSEMKYLWHYTEVFKDEFRMISTGTTFESVSVSDIKNSIFLAPPLWEQQKIAAFLDEKCGAIDEIISKTEQSIEEYKKLKQSVITKAVTKGIRSNRPMQDSNIEWIGEIPTDWEIKKFRNILKERTEKNVPIKSTERLSLSIDLGVTLYAEKTTNLDRFKDDFEQYKIAHEGDLVMNSMNMIIGAVGVSKYYGCVSPVYYTWYDETPNHTTAKYCEYLLRCKTIKKVLFALGRGIYAIERGDDRVNTCRLKISRDDLKNLKLPLPSLDEQAEIINYLDEKCAEIDTLIEKKQQFLAEMANYKKSLIYEYVTGKKEVA